MFLTEGAFAMRYVLLLACGLALATTGCKLIQVTQGVCDCDPPPVHSVLQSPYAPAYGAAPAVAPAAVHAPHGH